MTYCFPLSCELNHYKQIPTQYDPPGMHRPSVARIWLSYIFPSTSTTGAITSWIYKALSCLQWFSFVILKASLHMHLFFKRSRERPLEDKNYFIIAHSYEIFVISLVYHFIYKKTFLCRNQQVAHKPGSIWMKQWEVTIKERKTSSIYIWSQSRNKIAFVQWLKKWPSRHFQGESSCRSPLFKGQTLYAITSLIVFQ